MSRRVILVHGFNVSDDGKRTVETLAPYFTAAGFEILRLPYGWTGLAGVRLFNGRFAKMLAGMTSPGDIVVGHSNGCAIAYEAACKGAPFGQMVFINPALDNDVIFPPQVGRVHVWYSPSDDPVWFSRLLLRHAWGDMGAVGYRGPLDRRVSNYDKENDFLPYISREHSDVFQPAKIQHFGPLIVEAVVAQQPVPTAA